MNILSLIYLQIIKHKQQTNNKMLIFQMFTQWKHTTISFINWKGYFKHTFFSFFFLNIFWFCHVWLYVCFSVSSFTSNILSILINHQMMPHWLINHNIFRSCWSNKTFHYTDIYLQVYICMHVYVHIFIRAWV